MARFIWQFGQVCLKNALLSGMEGSRIALSWRYPSVKGPVAPRTRALLVTSHAYVTSMHGTGAKCHFWATLQENGALTDIFLLKTDENSIFISQVGKTLRNWGPNLRLKYTKLLIPYFYWKGRKSLNTAKNRALQPGLSNRADLIHFRTGSDPEIYSFI